MGILVDTGFLQQLCGAGLDQHRLQLGELLLREGDSVTGSAFFPQYPGKLLVGGLPTLEALHVIHRAQLGQPRRQPRHLDLKILRAASRT